MYIRVVKFLCSTILQICGVMLISMTASHADTDISASATLNSAGEYYRLTKDISAAGTAFTVTGSDITLDLQGHTVTYNTDSSGSSIYGVSISANNVTVKNGIIIQGSGKSSYSPVIYISSGSGHKLSYLVLKPTGVKTYGISGNRNTEIHHVYIESHTTTSCDRGDGIAAIHLEGGSGGGNVYDNILVNGHTGVVLVRGSQDTQLYNNKIQQKRRPGCKAPYGIGLSSSIQNVNVYNNQIISDDGRGIILDGWYQGATNGSTNHNIHDNRVDVQYSQAATGGYYVENNVFGLYDRYGSGNNTFENNVIIVDSKVGGITAGAFVGSDGPDSYMKGLVYRSNTFVARKGSVMRYAVAEEVTVVNNNYIGPIFSEGNWDYHNNGGINTLVESGNTSITLENYIPAAPSGLKITKFLNSYLLTWNDNLNSGESQTYEYIVFRDSQKLPISPRGGTFYVDVDVTGSHKYAVSAVNLAGVEGSASQEISTASAANGWWEGGTSAPSDSTPPNAPLNLDIN